MKILGTMEASREVTKDYAYISTLTENEVLLTNEMVK